MSQADVTYPPGPFPADTADSIAEIMREVGITNLSIKILRRRLETKYKIDFTAHKEQIQTTVDAVMSTKEFQKELAKTQQANDASKEKPRAKKTARQEKEPKTSTKGAKAPKESKKEAKAKKPDNYPKAALSGYFLFAGDQRGEIKTQNPTYGVAEIGKEIGNRWKDASEATKQKYNDLAAADKQRFEKEMNEFRAAGGEVIKRGGKKDKKGKKSKKEKKEGPKRATTAYMLFLNAKRPEINAANPGIKITEVPKKASELWNALSAEQQAPWNALAAKDKERFIRECAEQGIKTTAGTTKAPAKKRAKKETASSSSSSSSSDSSSDSSSSDSSSSDSSSSDSDSD